MIRVHYLEDSRAHRVLWLLEELCQDYEVVLYRRGKDMRAPKELKEVHPLGKSPIVEDEGTVMAESGPIAEWLLDRYGAGAALRPEPGEPGFDAYRYWMHYAEGSAMPLLVQKLVFSRLPRNVPALIRPLARMITDGAQKGWTDPQIRDHVAFWDSTLAQSAHFAGEDFTAADIQMSFPVEAALDRAMKGGTPRHIARWLDSVRARPAYIRATRKGAYRYGPDGSRR